MEAGSLMTQRLPEAKQRFFFPLARKITPRNAVPLALALTVILGVLDFVTGIELAFTLLYLVPIAFATWFHGRTLGVVVATLCVTSAATIDTWMRLEHHWRIHPFTMVWNHGGTMVLYGLGIAVLWRLRAFVEKEERERVLTVEQLRHAERLNMIGKLAAGVAHELGTPMNVILVSAETIETDPTSTSATREAAERIQRHTTKMAHTIRQLLDFSRKGGHEQVTIDLCVLTREVVRLLETFARKHKAKLVVDAPAKDPILVRANRIELEQVLNNLVVNAIQAMPAGGVIRVRCDVRESGSTPLASLTVADQGVGIQPEDLARVFDPFFTTKEVGAGTGLGLSVSYGIVHDHGGTMSVDSRIGVGSEFTVLLPLHD
ncbi:MAG: Sensor histidine kinase [Myxococcaceae bacterium]|nr:Sensor histidine kinase [Myxococcaceae bacterium]